MSYSPDRYPGFFDSVPVFILYDALYSSVDLSRRTQYVSQLEVGLAVVFTRLVMLSVHYLLCSFNKYQKQEILPSLTAFCNWVITYNADFVIVL